MKKCVTREEPEGLAQVDIEGINKEDLVDVSGVTFDTAVRE